MTELISVIVATYNRPDALDVCLRSLSHQTDRIFEVVVADDGSDTRTAEIVNKWSKRIGVPLKHAWHSDDGFRLAEIRNRALRISAGNYCIFLDGDCLARPDFVAAHRELMEPGWFVTGNRVLLSRELSERILRDGIAPEQWALGQWFVRRCHGDINRLLPLLGMRPAFFRKLSPRRWRGARGSNMAFWRQDLDAVDAFDGTFRGWGREDSDIFIRLIRNRVRRKDGRFGTAVLHLWHPEADRSHLAENERHIQALLAGKRVRSLRGLSQIVREVELMRRERQVERVGT